MKKSIDIKRLLSILLCATVLMTGLSLSVIISLAGTSTDNRLILHNCDSLPAVSSGASAQLCTDNKNEGTSSVKVKSDSASGKWSVAFSFSASNISMYDFVSFDVYTENSQFFSKTNTDAIVFQFDTKNLHKMTDKGNYIKKEVTAGKWFTVKIPVADIKAKGIDTTKISYFAFSNTKVVTGGQNGQEFFIDDIRAENDVQFDVDVSSVGGTVTPNGSSKVSIGKDITLKLTPNKDYLLEYIEINGKKVTDIDEFTEEYVIKSISENLNISVKFKEAPNLYYKVTANAGENGSISPSGEKTVRYGTKLTYTITPNEDFFIKYLTVNGEDVETTTEYTTKPIKGDTDILVEFGTYKLFGDEAVVWNCESNPDVVSFDANTQVDKSIYSEGRGCLKVETNETTGKFQIIKNFSNNIDASDYDYLRFDVYVKNGEVLAKTSELMFMLDAFEQHRVQDFGKYLMYMNNVLKTEEWYTVTIPLKEFTQLGTDIKNITQFGICNGQGVWGDQEGEPFWIDNVRFAKALKHEVTATSSAHGKISPEGVSKVIDGESIVYTFTPDENYMIDYFSVDGKKITSVDRFTYEYELTEVKEAHTVHIEYKESPNVFYDVTSLAGKNGTISPSGTLSVREGERVKYTITPNKGYIIDTITVNGKIIENTLNYTLMNVVADTNIEVKFKKPDSTDQPGEKTLMLFDCETADVELQHNAIASLDNQKKTEGNFSLKIDSGANGDMRFQANVDPVDASGYDYLLLDVCGTDTDTFWKNNHLFYSLGGGVVSECENDVPMMLKRMHIFSDNTAGNGWVTVAIPLSVFEGKANLSSVSTFLFGMDNGRWDGKSSETVWFDNIRFSKNTDFTVKSSHILASGNEKTKGVSGSVETDESFYTEGNNSFHILTGSSGESDSWITVTPADATQYKYLQFDFRISNKSFVRDQMYFAVGLDTTDKALVIDAGQWLTERYINENEWHTVTIPLSYFEGKSDLTYVKKIRFVSAGHMYGGSLEADFFIDNIRLSSLDDVNYKAPAIREDEEDDGKPKYSDDDDLYADFEFNYYMKPDNFDVDGVNSDDSFKDEFFDDTDFEETDFEDDDSDNTTDIADSDGENPDNTDSSNIDSKIQKKKSASKKAKDENSALLWIILSAVLVLSCAIVIVLFIRHRKKR